MLSPVINEVMPPHFPERRGEAHCNWSHYGASQKGLIEGISSVTIYSAHLGSCIKIIARLFKHYTLISTAVLKKTYKQAHSKRRCLETSLKLEVVRSFLRQKTTRCLPYWSIFHDFDLLFFHSKWELLITRICEPLSYTSPHSKDWKQQSQAWSYPAQSLQKDY